MSRKRDYDVARSLHLSTFITERVGVAKIRVAIYARINSGEMTLLEEWHYYPGNLIVEGLPKLAEYFDLWLREEAEATWGDVIDFDAADPSELGGPLTLPME